MHLKICVMLLVATSLCLWKLYYSLPKLSQKYVYRNANSHYFKHQRGRKTSLLALIESLTRRNKNKSTRRGQYHCITTGWCWYGTFFLLWSLTRQAPKTPKEYLMVSPLEILPNNPCRFSTQTFHFFRLSIVSARALAYLAVPAVPNHCSCTSHTSEPFQDGESEA